MIRNSAGPLIALMIALLACAQPCEAASIDDEVNDAVAKLADGDASVRDQAAQELWSAGASAEAALRSAAAGDDPETARRARGILARLELGLHPDAPPQLLEIVEQYRTGQAPARRAAITTISRFGRRGLRVLVGLRQRERDESVRKAILDALGARPNVRESAALLVAVGDDAPAAGVLLAAAADEGGDAALRDWATLLLLRGGLDERIAQCQAALKEAPDGHAATRLAMLERTGGRLPNAVRAAEQADDSQLVDSLLIEQGNWKALAARYHERVGSTSDTLGFTAAFCRLTGDAAGLDAAAASLRSFADHSEDEYWNCAECLMLNDRVDEGVAVLLSHKNYLAALDFLLGRLRIPDALALPGKAAADLRAAELLQVRARAIAAYRFAGDRADARQALDDVAAANEAERDARTWTLLTEAARQLGEPARADRFLARAMELAEPVEGPMLLGIANVPDGLPIAFWWRLLRLQDVGKPYVHTLARLRALASGAMRADELRAVIDADRTDGRAVPPAEASRDRRLELIADSLRMLGRTDESERIYREVAARSPSAGLLQSIGSIQAARGDFARAAESFGSAWDMDPTRAVPLALRGWALLKAGDAVAAQGLFYRAHLLPLADETQRTTLEEAFRQHGLPDEARRERELILRTAPFLSWEVCNANRVSGDELAARGDPLAAADAWERAFLGNLQSHTTFLEPWANVMIPTMIHRARARGLAKVDAAAAVREAHLMAADSPADANAMIDVVQALDGAGHRTEADALYAGSAALYVKLCEAYPASGPAHNQLAWLGAGCRRDLDGALKHARRAVEVEPTNTASIDTLAEVYFQRGEVPAAIEQMKRCVELEPAVARHREQINRFERARSSNAEQN